MAASATVQLIVTVTRLSSTAVAGVSTGVGSCAVAVRATVALSVSETAVMVPVAGSVPSKVTVTTVLLFGLAMVVGLTVKCVLSTVSVMGSVRWAPPTVKVCESCVLVKASALPETVSTGS